MRIHDATLTGFAPGFGPIVVPIRVWPGKHYEVGTTQYHVKLYTDAKWTGVQIWLGYFDDHGKRIA